MVTRIFKKLGVKNKVEAIPGAGALRG